MYVKLAQMEVTLIAYLKSAYIVQVAQSITQL